MTDSPLKLVVAYCPGLSFLISEWSKFGPKVEFGPIFKKLRTKKKASNLLKLLAYCLVAGAGFEPTTFRL